MNDFEDIRYCLEMVALLHTDNCWEQEIPDNTRSYLLPSLFGQINLLSQT